MNEEHCNRMRRENLENWNLSLLLYIDTELQGSFTETAIDHSLSPLGDRVSKVYIQYVCVSTKTDLYCHYDGEV